VFCSCQHGDDRGPLWCTIESTLSAASSALGSGGHLVAGVGAGDAGAPATPTCGISRTISLTTASRTAWICAAAGSSASPAREGREENIGHAPPRHPLGREAVVLGDARDVLTGKARTSGSPSRPRCSDPCRRNGDRLPARRNQTLEVDHLDTDCPPTPVSRPPWAGLHPREMVTIVTSAPAPALANPARRTHHGALRRSSGRSWPSSKAR
jgi:hypothetical protein